MIITGVIIPSVVIPNHGPAPGVGGKFGAERHRPNVLVIITDDQRGGLEVMPKTRRHLVNGGTKFTHAFPTTPLCCPSRATIMTGQYAHNHGVHSNEDAAALDHARTLQAVFDEHGYRTAIFGKFLNKWPIADAPPNFDRYALLDIRAQDRQAGYYGATWNVNGNVRRLPGYSTSIIARKGAQFIRSSEHRATPWLAFLTPYAPHVPYTPHPRFASAQVPRWPGNPAVREADKRDKPMSVRTASRTPAQGRRTRRGQFRTLMSVDRLVGRVVRTLKRSGALSDTLIVFVSDNGFFWGEHGLTGKNQPYVHGARVPLLLSWPGRVAEGVRDGRLTGNIDIAPTLFDAAGIAPPDDMVLDGRSLFEDRRRQRMLLEFWESRNLGPWAATITKHLQYIERYDEDEVVLRELYRLDHDPWQLTNVLADGDAGNDPSAVELERLHIQLQEDRDCSGASCP